MSNLFNQFIGLFLTSYPGYNRSGESSSKASSSFSNANQNILSYRDLHSQTVEHIHAFELKLAEKLSMQLVLDERQIVGDEFGADLGGALLTRPRHHGPNQAASADRLDLG